MADSASTDDSTSRNNLSDDSSLFPGRAETVLGEDTRKLVEDTSVFPYNCVCCVRATFFGNVNRFQPGTAFLTSEERVILGVTYVLAITAAHVLCFERSKSTGSGSLEAVQERSKEATATSVSLWPGFNGDDKGEVSEIKIALGGHPNTGWFTVSEGWMLDLGLDNFTEHDYGAIFVRRDLLPESLHNPGSRIKLRCSDDVNDLGLPTHKARTQSSPATELRIVGYPYEKPFGTMWEAQGPIYQPHRPGKDNLRVAHRTPTSTGQSGSPVLLVDKLEAVAMHTRGADGYPYNIGLIMCRHRLDCFMRSDPPPALTRHQQNAKTPDSRSRGGFSFVPFNALPGPHNLWDLQ